ncbi:MAG: portal protein [Candidatus Omnitrophota bacterium]
MDKVQEIKSHFKYLKKIKDYWKDIWQDVADYVIPIREDLEGTKTPGALQGTKAYDSTAISALNMFADGLHGYMISPATRWFSLRLPRNLRQLENIPEVRIWIQDVQDCIYSAFQNSNFYTEMRSYFKDGGSIGTASLYFEEDMLSGKLMFTCLHPREGYIAEDRFGNIDTFFRKIKFTARQAKQSFGEENLSREIRNVLKSNPYYEFEFLHAVYPREDFDTRKLGSKYKRFASIWCEYNANNLLRESGYNIFPYMVWRYARSGNEVYGRSPAMFALPEIKGLNAIAKDMLGAAQLAVRPPYNIPVEMKDKVRLTPMGMNYYGADYNRRISPVTTGINFPVGIDREDKKRETIEKLFHIDFFMMLQRAEREMTATEIMERMGEKASVLSASIGDLTVVIDKIIDNVFAIEYEARRIPPIPEVLVAYGGQNIDIDYMGPLAQAQKRLFDTQPIRTGIELAAPILQIYPESADLINAEEMLKELLVSNGFPQTVLNTPEMIIELRRQRAAIQMNETKKLDMERFSEIIKKLSQATKNSKASGEDISAQLQQIMGGGAPANA